MHPQALEKLQPGQYDFSWSYSPAEFIDHLNEGPARHYINVTILEGRSIYDIDDYLVKNSYANAWDYRSYVSDPVTIESIASKYSFVKQFIDSQPWSDKAIPNLEWLLYPDTYTIDMSQPIIYQLVSLQLKAFQSKVYEVYQGEIDDFSSTLRANWYDFNLGRYNIVSLASIIEKEEKNDANKPTIAGIFLNRIQDGMRLDADITLCYGLHQSYAACSPSVIVKNLNDASNLYNTRVHTWLTPWLISNPAVSTFESLLHFKKSDYYYYLHSSKGTIHYGSTIQEHNANKQFL